jgi:hypothetical protein
MKRDGDESDEVNESTVEAEETDVETVLENTEENSAVKDAEPVKEKDLESGSVSDRLDATGEIDMVDRFMSKVPVNEESEQKIAMKKDEISRVNTTENSDEQIYRVEDFVSADPDVTPMLTAEFVQKDAVADIVEKLQQIIDVEAPIHYDRMTKKVLRAFGIGRSSAQTLEAVDKAVKKTVSKTQKQSGIKFVWRRDQDPNTYRVYRIDVAAGDKRSADEICQQELKNAICVTLAEKGALDKETLIKETIRTMGYTRSGAALVEAVNKGIKYGRKTGEIIVNEDKRFDLPE